jgi:hypothetical protein
MALPAISKEINFKKSLRKYFYSRFNPLDSSPPPDGGDSVSLLFDQGLGSPTSPTGDPAQWLSIEFGSFIVGTVNTASISVYCCAQKDTDSDEVTLLRDRVIEAFVDTNSTSVDGIRRIPIYIDLGEASEEIIGYMVAEIGFQSRYSRAADGTKFNEINIIFRWGANYIEP